MVKFEVNLTEPAENDLRDIATYISTTLLEPNAAFNTIEAIETKIDKLETMALAYPLVRDDYLASLGYRLMPVKNYHVFYIVYEKEKSVDVDRILYGRRNWKHILGPLPADPE
jgi:plasmid stabilization system protein ParE